MEVIGVEERKWRERRRRERRRWAELQPVFIEIMWLQPSQGLCQRGCCSLNDISSLLTSGGIELNFHLNKLYWSANEEILWFHKISWKISKGFFSASDWLYILAGVRLRPPSPLATWACFSDVEVTGCSASHVHTRLQVFWLSDQTEAGKKSKTVIMKWDGCGCLFLGYSRHWFVICCRTNKQSCCFVCLTVAPLTNKIVTHLGESGLHNNGKIKKKKKA